jgi:hypothetical protein
MESSRGIQQLMEAEQSATKIVQEMREGQSMAANTRKEFNRRQGV